MNKLKKVIVSLLAAVLLVASVAPVAQVEVFAASSPTNSVAISDCTFNITKNTYTYSKSASRTPVLAVSYNGTTLKAGTDYVATWSSSKTNAGTYKLNCTIKGKGKYTGTKSLTNKTLIINQALQNVVVSGNSRSINCTKVNKTKTEYVHNYTLSAKASNSSATFTYKKVSGSAKLTISKDGKVSTKKGLKKGTTYQMVVEVTASGNNNFKQTTRDIIFKVTVK